MSLLCNFSLSQLVPVDVDFACLERVKREIRARWMVAGERRVEMSDNYSNFGPRQREREREKELLGCELKERAFCRTGMNVSFWLVCLHLQLARWPAGASLFRCALSSTAAKTIHHRLARREKHKDRWKLSICSPTSQSFLWARQSSASERVLAAPWSILGLEWTARC